MPKLFPIHIEVEEVALGRVMRILHNTEGVAKINLQMEEPKAKPNGFRSHHPRSEENGQSLALKILAKKPASRKDLMASFVAQGRSGKSINSVLWNLQQDKLIARFKDGAYHLTAKGRGA